MPRCQARLPLLSLAELTVGPSGFPRKTPRYCGQTVAVRTWTDELGRQRAACPLAGHLDDVQRQSEAEVRAHYEAIAQARAEFGNPFGGGMPDLPLAQIRQIRPEAR